MSFEGYYQILCEKGHETNLDCYLSDIEHGQCRCGAKFVWYHGVDETNGCHHAYQHHDRVPIGLDKKDRRKYCPAHPLDLEIKTPEQYEKCPHCGHQKLLEEETYKVPASDGHKVGGT